MVNSSTISERGVLLQISDKLNAENVHELNIEIIRILNNESDLVVIDLESLNEIDSTGIGVILSLQKRMQQNGGEVKIIRINGTVKKLFDLLHINRSMNICDSLEEAIA